MLRQPASQSRSLFTFLLDCIDNPTVRCFHSNTWSFIIGPVGGLLRLLVHLFFTICDTNRSIFGPSEIIFQHRSGHTSTPDRLYIIPAIAIFVARCIRLWIFHRSVFISLPTNWRGCKLHRCTKGHKNPFLGSFKTQQQVCNSSTAALVAKANRLSKTWNWLVCLMFAKLMCPPIQDTASRSQLDSGNCLGTLAKKFIQHIIRILPLDCPKGSHYESR